MLSHLSRIYKHQIMPIPCHLIYQRMEVRHAILPDRDKKISDIFLVLAISVSIKLMHEHRGEKILLNAMTKNDRIS